MKKLNLNDFAKANVAIGKKGMMFVKGGELKLKEVLSHLTKVVLRMVEK